MENGTKHGNFLMLSEQITVYQITPLIKKRFARLKIEEEGKTEITVPAFPWTKIVKEFAFHY